MITVAPCGKVDGRAPALRGWSSGRCWSRGRAAGERGSGVHPQVVVALDVGVRGVVRVDVDIGAGLVEGARRGVVVGVEGSVELGGVRGRRVGVVERAVRVVVAGGRGADGGSAAV